MATFRVSYVFDLIDKVTRPLRRMQRDFNRARQRVDRFARVARKTDQTTKAMGSSVQRAAGNVSMLGRAANTTQAALASMQAAMSRVARTSMYNRGWSKMGGYEKAARDDGKSASGILAGQKRDRQLRDAFQNRKWLPGKMIGAGAVGGLASSMGGSPQMLGVGGAGLGAVSLLKRFGSFEAAEIYVSTIGRKLGNTEKSLKSLSQQARKLGSSTIFEPQDVLGGGLTFMKAGRSATEAMQSLRPALTLAAAAEMDVTKASKSVLNIMALGKVKPENLTKVIDALTASFLSAKVEMTELAQAAPYLMPKLTNLAVPINQQFAALSALAEGGQSGSRGARGLAMAITQIQKAPFMKKQSGLMKKYGFKSGQFFGSDGKLKDLFGLLKHIKDVEARSGGEFMSQFFPANALRVMESLINNLHIYERVMKNIPKLDGVAEDIAQSKFKGLIGSTKQLNAAWSELGVTFGESGPGKFVENAIRQITDAVNSFRNSIKMGTLIEELFDPKMIFLRAGQATASLAIGFTQIVSGALAAALNRVGSLFGNSQMGNQLKSWLGLDDLVKRLRSARDYASGEAGERLSRVRKEAKAASAATVRSAYLHPKAQPLASGNMLAALREQQKVDVNVKLDPLRVLAPNSIKLTGPLGNQVGTIPLTTNQPKGTATAQQPVAPAQ